MSHFLRDMFSSADAVRQRQLEELNSRFRLPCLGTQTDKFFSSYRRALRSTVVSGGSAPFRAAVIHGILRQYAAQGVPTTAATSPTRAVRSLRICMASSIGNSPPFARSGAA